MSLIQDALRRKQSEEGRAPQPSADQALPSVQVPRYVAKPAPAVTVVRVACYAVLFLGAGAGLLSLARSFQTPGAADQGAVVVASLPEMPGDSVLAKAPLDLVEPLHESEPQVRATEPVRALVEPAPRTFKMFAKAEPAGPAAWPELKVMGVFARPNPSDSTAIIDGQLEDVGTEMDGVVLAEVRNNGVLFTYRGEEKFVRVGRTTVK